MNPVVEAWRRIRDGFSAKSLELTSSATPLTVSGGLPLGTRAGIAAAALSLSTALAALAEDPFGAIFFFPALAVAGVFGGIELGLAVLAACIILTRVMFPTTPPLLLDLGMALQVGLALVGRVFFRESRVWGVRHRRLLSSVSSATTVSDAQGRIERPHPEMEKLLGMKWPDYSGVRWLKAVHPDDVAKIAPQTPDNNGGVQRAEIRLKDPASGDWHWYLMRAMPLFDEEGKVVEWISALTDIHQTKLAQEHQAIVIGEARHRLKNLITIIESLAKSSRPKDDAAVDEFLKKFSGRLHALSAAGDLALASNYSVIAVDEIVRATLAPFLETESKRLTFGGPKLALSEATSGGLALGIHELTTNAIKYGALSMPEGHVSFTWNVEPRGEDEFVTMEWAESGGQKVAATDREGYGSRVIKFIPSREKNGKVDIEYRPDGYFCRITFTQHRH